MTHGHEILAMLQERPYTFGELMQAIYEKYGPEETFYTCHADNLRPEELIVFFLERGKIQMMASGAHCGGHGEEGHDCHGEGHDCGCEQGHHCCHEESKPAI